jgi:hypothetical protein
MPSTGSAEDENPFFPRRRAQLRECLVQLRESLIVTVAGSQPSQKNITTITEIGTNILIRVELF